MVKNDPLESRSTRTIKSNYSKYLAAIVDKSIKLTKACQNETALWDNQSFSNIDLAKITERLLPKL
jgi:hypothetical protein